MLNGPDNKPQNNIAQKFTLSIHSGVNGAVMLYSTLASITSNQRADWRNIKQHVLVSQSRVI